MTTLEVLQKEHLDFLERSNWTVSGMQVQPNACWVRWSDSVYLVEALKKLEAELEAVDKELILAVPESAHCTDYFVYEAALAREALRQKER